MDDPDKIHGGAEGKGSRGGHLAALTLERSWETGKKQLWLVGGGSGWGPHRGRDRF